MRRISWTKIFVLLLISIALAGGLYWYWSPVDDDVPADPGARLWRYVAAPVGQADGTALVSPDGHVAVIDAATAGGVAALTRWLDYMGVERIDTLVLTHPHMDHIGGTETLLDNYEIGEVWDVQNDHTGQTYMDLLERIDTERISYRTVHRTQNLELLPGLTVDIINPPDPPRGDLNELSISFPITINGVTILTTGDAYIRQEDEWVREELIDNVDILKAGHHGSSTSTGRILLENTRPDAAIIPAPEDSPYDHPHDEVLDRLDRYNVDVYQTGLHGYVEVLIDPDAPAGDYTIQTYGYMDLYARYRPRFGETLLDSHWSSEKFEDKVEIEYGDRGNDYSHTPNEVELHAGQESALWYGRVTAPRLFYDGELPEEWLLETGLNFEVEYGRESGIVVFAGQNNWFHWGPTGEGNITRLMVNKPDEDITTVREYDGIAKEIGLAYEDGKYVPLFRPSGEDEWRKLTPVEISLTPQQAQVGIYAKSWLDRGDYRASFHNLRLHELQ